MAQRATSPAEDHSLTSSGQTSATSTFNMSAADAWEGTNAAASPLCAVLHPSEAQCPRRCPGHSGPSCFNGTPASSAISEQSPKIQISMNTGDAFSSLYKQGFTPGQAHLAQPEVRTGELPAKDRIDSKMTGRKRSSTVVQHTEQPQQAEGASSSAQVDRPGSSTQTGSAQAPASAQAPGRSLPPGTSLPPETALPPAPSQPTAGPRPSGASQQTITPQPRATFQTAPGPSRSATVPSSSRPPTARPPLQSQSLPSRISRGSKINGWFDGAWGVAPGHETGHMRWSRIVDRATRELDSDEDPFLDGPARTIRPQSPGTSARNRSTERLLVNNEVQITAEEHASQYRTEPSGRSSWM
jgi:hypothetical protein